MNRGLCIAALWFAAGLVPPQRMSRTRMVPRTELEEHFERTMKDPKVPLFADFETYLTTLPSRRYDVTGETIRLCDLGFWAKDDDVDAMAMALELKSPKAEAIVKYVAGPPSSGKTSSILVAFLASAKMGRLTHYLYLGRSDASPVAAVKRLLRNADSTDHDTLETVLDDAIPDGRILIHLEDEVQRGWMDALLTLSRVTVVVTSTRPPAETSRYPVPVPVPVPVLDVDKVIDEIEQLQWPTDVGKFDQPQRRLMETLRFRLAAKLSDDGLLAVHQRSDEFIRFLDAFQKEAHKATNTTDARKNCRDALGRCVEVCTLRPFRVRRTGSAANLLLGGLDDEKDDIKDVVACSGELMTSSSLRGLLSMTDPAMPLVYANGQARLASVLRSPATDLQSSPLEAAYAWTLACRSASHGCLRFLDFAPAFGIRCKNLKVGRLFQSTNTGSFQVPDPDNVLYYVDEGPGKGTHPLADLFFRTTRDVVLVDIFGGANDDKVREKIGKFTRWLPEARDLHQRSLRRSFLRKTYSKQHHQQRSNSSSSSSSPRPRFPPPSDSDGRRLSFHGVILAPFVDGTSAMADTMNSSSLTVVRGEDAMELLGGLRQVSRWLESKT